MANRTFEQYTNLIPYPNNQAPRFMEWVGVVLQMNVDTQTVLNEMIEAFNIDTAIGDQLDIIGESLGQPRLLNFQPGGGVSAVLKDPIYRLVLKAKILKNIWKGTIAEIYDFWEVYFPENPILITDNQDMTMTVTTVGIPDDLEPDAVLFGYDTDTDTIKGFDQGYWEGFGNLITDLIQRHYFCPKPAGVTVFYQFITDPVFAYDSDSEYLKGYDSVAEWIAPL